VARVQIAIVAGEPSGDRLGAGLVRELLRRHPGLEIEGVGGPGMEDAGCRMLYHMDRIGVMGLDGLREKLGDILAIRRDLAKRWAANPPDAFVGVDVPDFNLGLEVRLRRRGIPCVHYVSPTVWAWRGYRIHKIRRAVDHMLALFPFEEKYYRQHRIPVTCVGHPMADQIGEPDPAAARSTLALTGEPIVALLPGSRRSEVSRLAEPLLAAARQLMERYPDIRFVLPFANDGVRRVFAGVAGDLSDLPLVAIDGNARLALEAADVAVLASGTASLEAALLRVPHVVVYRLPPVSFWLMGRLRQVDHFAMPNHLLPSPRVPELIQHQATPENIVAAVCAYLQNPDLMQQLRDEFAAIHQDLNRDADRLAGDVVEQYIGRHDS
jgi:lipid-A-disaccharide synthase